MRSFTLSFLTLALALALLSLSLSLSAGASPSSPPSVVELDLSILKQASYALASPSKSLSASGFSAFSKRAVKGISSYTGPTKGHATFYGNNGSGGACLLPARSDFKFVAFPGASWSNSANCGACMRVTGPNGAVDVQVTNEMSPLLLFPLLWPPPSAELTDQGGDYCPECPPGSLDLSTSAFSKIAGTSKGKVDITWKWIDCRSAGLESGKPSVVWKSDSTAYWMAIQIRHSAFPIASVSIRAATASTYTSLKRENYNYFSATSGVGAGPFVVLVRYQDGSKAVIKDLKLNSVIGDA